MTSFQRIYVFKNLERKVHLDDIYLFDYNPTFYVTTAGKTHQPATGRRIQFLPDWCTARTTHNTSRYSAVSCPETCRSSLY